MFRREPSLRDRIRDDGWIKTANTGAREGLSRAGAGATRLGALAALAGARTWKEARRAGGRARVETARARKGLVRAMPARRARRERRRRAAMFAGGTALGAVAAYFLDPVQGKGRRVRLRDRTAALVRSASGRARRAGRRIASDAEGLTERMQYGTRDYAPANDVTLAHKVESEVLGRPDVRSGSVAVNAEHGVVILRGQVDHPDLIVDLEAATRRVDGVRDVENLLHLPGQVAPNKAEVRGRR